MMRILLRAAKGPFEVVSAEATLERNRIATNVGNLLFSHSVWKMLLTPQATIDAVLNPANADESGRINETYDVFVIPLANAFRPDFERHLIGLTRLVERLTIPVVVIGVGAQTELDYSLEPMRPLNATVTAFCRAVLDRSPSIGVRGELTQAYLSSLGFSDVDIIGCPSMFLHGSHLQVERRSALARDAKVVLSVSPLVDQMEAIATQQWRLYPNATYIPQDTAELEMLLWGDADDTVRKKVGLPLPASHPLFTEDKVRFFHDPWTWLDYLSGTDFSLGSRLHGNVAAVLAGTPGYILAHDSRTLELARYHEIPHRKITDVPLDVDAAQLYDEADFGPMMRGHKGRFDALTGFLDKHRLEYVFDPDRLVAFDEKVRSTPFPAASHTINEPSGRELVQRLRWLRSENVDRRREGAATKRELAERKRESATHKQEAADLRRRNTQLSKQLDEEQREIGRMSARLTSLERQVSQLQRTPMRRLRRRVGRLARSIRRSVTSIRRAA